MDSIADNNETTQQLNISKARSTFFKKRKLNNPPLHTKKGVNEEVIDTRKYQGSEN